MTDSQAPAKANVPVRPRMLATALVAAAMSFAIALAGVSAVTPAVAQGPQSVAPLADRLIGAVVNISTRQKSKTARRRGALPKVPKGSPFEDLFEDFFQKDQGSGSQKIASLGSGFVINGREGLIVTNNHVIEGADEITINFYDGRKLKVDKVLGVDKKTDLALLKVTPPSPLKDVPFGSSQDIQVGDWVLAIGNPFGLGGSVSVGIISAKERDIRSGPYDDYLQTDAAINKGNSGGPLFNMRGEVVGVNTAIISPTGGSIGIGFSVPSDTATLVIDQLRRYGETRRGWLGVNIQTVTEELALALKIPANKGALISSVAEGGPAAEAGIKPGDVVLTFDGRNVKSMRALPRLVARTGEGKTVDVGVLRKDERLTLKVTIGRLDEKPKQASFSPAKPGQTPGAQPQSPQPAPAPDVILGMTLTPLTDALAKQYKLKPSLKGLVVTKVDAKSKASEKGIKVGDLIAEASGTLVPSKRVFQAQVESVKARNRRSILLRVVSGDGSFRFVAVPVS
ncbi:MAG: Do family serine endopeptidase [Pseudomonadota bacterium]